MQSGYEECPQCEGAGETHQSCAICASTGMMPHSTVRIYEAWLRVQRRSGYELGAEDGSTEASLAHWWEIRQDFGRIVLVRGRPDGKGFAEAVEILNKRGDLARFTGLAWGYSGTGPNGLAAILCDSGAFLIHQDALRFVARIPQAEPFRIRLSKEDS